MLINCLCSNLAHCLDACANIFSASMADAESRLYLDWVCGWNCGPSRYPWQKDIPRDTWYRIASIRELKSYLLLQKRNAIEHVTLLSEDIFGLCVQKTYDM
jgi:hypothetical protein